MDLLKREIEDVLATIPGKVASLHRIKLKDIDLSQAPPSFNCISLHTSHARDDVAFHFTFDPELRICCAIVFDVQVIGRVRLNACVTVHSFRGCFRLFIPMRAGPMQIAIERRTNISCDFEAKLGSLLAVSTPKVQGLWTSLLSWFHTFVHSKVIPIELEDSLRVPELSAVEKRGKRRRWTAPVRKERRQSRIRVRRRFDVLPCVF
jgi:hypothetical protein